MSGGHFDYNQYYLQDITDEIERLLSRQGKSIPKDELYMTKDYYDNHPEETHYEVYSPNVRVAMEEAIEHLKMASLYVHRIDWLLSGDDDEESFLRKLSEDFENLYKK